MPAPERAWPPGGIVIGDEVWDPWHPAQAARLLTGLTVPWYVAGGWALDLGRGMQTREHEDLEIAIPDTADAFRQVRDALGRYDFQVAGGPPPGWLWPLDSPAFAMSHQTWVSEPGDADGRRVYRLDVFREPQREGRWVCRRDELLTLPYEQVIRRDRDGIPYLAPQFVLLFKAKASRPKDLADFTTALPLLHGHERAWLSAALTRLHPGHEWIGDLRPLSERQSG